MQALVRHVGRSEISMLKREIVRSAEGRSFSNAVGLLIGSEVAQDSVSLELVSDWHRPGAEAFICRFRLTWHDGCSDFLLKCPVSVAARPSDVIARWVDRSAHIQRYLPTATPKVYFSGGGTLCAEYIPYDFWELLGKAASIRERERMLASLAGMVSALAKGGFSPSDLSDLRSRGNDCVLVDVGDDLGASSPDRPYGDSCRTAVSALRRRPLSKRDVSYIVDHVQIHGT
ncbi:hypothetical protein B7C42_00226 [Nocardia cerradoensis]|uniref:Aminoglycoside phosphotransferase domain-containing protein n=1 Tax=Nocardia cerradoensis TaxID=85688 RepID=A0A231HDZ6_9NOCA|nr:hypothetical protein B7C42_00226 [Nocardia cerradoensis]